MEALCFGAPGWLWYIMMPQTKEVLACHSAYGDLRSVVAACWDAAVAFPAPNLNNEPPAESPERWEQQVEEALRDWVTAADAHVYAANTAGRPTLQIRVASLGSCLWSLRPSVLKREQPAARQPRSDQQEPRQQQPRQAAASQAVAESSNGPQLAAGIGTAAQGSNSDHIQHAASSQAATENSDDPQHVAAPEPQSDPNPPNTQTMIHKQNCWIRGLLLLPPTVLDMDGSVIALVLHLETATFAERWMRGFHPDATGPDNYQLKYALRYWGIKHVCKSMSISTEWANAEVSQLALQLPCSFCSLTLSPT